LEQAHRRELSKTVRCDKATRQTDNSSSHNEKIMNERCVRIKRSVARVNPDKFRSFVSSAGGFGYGVSFVRVLKSY